MAQALCVGRCVAVRYRRHTIKQNHLVAPCGITLFCDTTQRVCRGINGSSIGRLLLKCLPCPCFRVRNKIILFDEMNIHNKIPTCRSSWLSIIDLGLETSILNNSCSLDHHIDSAVVCLFRVPFQVCKNRTLIFVIPP